MTLVVARVTPDIGFLVADTLLSSEFQFKGREGPVNGKHHALKVQILNSFTAIAFAGDAEAAFNLIRNLHVELKENPSMDVPESLFQSYKQVIKESSANGQPPDCEFLVLQITSKRRRLAHVTRKGSFDCERAYIGDHKAYKRMRELQRPYSPPETQHVQQPDGTFRLEPLVASDGEIEFAEISNAIEELCHEKHCGTVGAICGGITRVVDARISGALEYLQQVEASISPTEGHSGFSVLASNISTRGVGIYIRSGGLGFLFVLGDFEPCRKVYARSLNEFVTLAKEKYGLNLTGGVWAD